MPFTSRSPRSRWLRLALAVLALAASNVRIAQAALGATCARTGAPSGAGIAVLAAVQHGSGLLDAATDASHDAPAPPVLASQCAPIAVVLSALVDVPAAVTAWDVSPPPAGPEIRPASHSPPPPFHPPRAI